MPWMRHAGTQPEIATRSAPNWIDFGVNDLETFRQPERPEVVTDVSGTILVTHVSGPDNPNGRAKNGLEPATSGVRGPNKGPQSSNYSEYAKDTAARCGLGLGCACGSPVTPEIGAALARTPLAGAISGLR